MNVLITGANRGIGAALKASYSAQGAHVSPTHRGPNKDGWITLDVTDADHIAQLAHTYRDRAVDILICNAGIFPDKAQSVDTGYPAKMWADTFATNVTGVFSTIQALVPALERAGGKIAIISSQMASSTRAPGGALIYRASKAAVLNLGRNLAPELAPRGIAVGIYHPGWVRTDMGGGSADIDTSEAAAGLVSRISALSLDTTGVFETWDGRAHAF